MKSEEAAPAGPPTGAGSVHLEVLQNFLTQMLQSEPWLSGPGRVSIIDLFTCSAADASPPENPPAGGARDQDEVGRRNSVGKSKAKAKKSDGSPPASSDLEVSSPAAAAHLQEGAEPQCSPLLLPASLPVGSG